MNSIITICRNGFSKNKFGQQLFDIAYLQCAVLVYKAFKGKRESNVSLMDFFFI